MNTRKYLLSSCVVILLVNLLWYYLVVPQIEKLPENFFYKADVFSLDNFYDEEKQEYSGEQISKTYFSYEVVSKKGHVLEIKNVFDVRKITGEKIFAVERVYGIDVLTGKHLKGYGDKDRTGYLFAPKHLKKQDYLYWHINYDEPAHLEFQKEEVIQGLKVFRYEVDFHGDQTANLGFLPGVPEKRGVNLDINLQVWVEPVTGWLVKYEDHTTAYYYDIQTGQRLHPWNKFNNKYSDYSVAFQVKNAKAKKLNFVLFRKVIPICFTVFVFLFTFILIHKPSKADVGRKEEDLAETTNRGLRPFRSIFFLFLLLLAGGVIGYGIINVASQKKIIKIGISEWVPNTLLEENIRGFKDALRNVGYQEGENIQYIYETPNADKNKQMEIIRHFVEQEVDLIYTLTTPGTLIAKSVTSEVPIVFSVVTYPVEANIIQSLDHSGNNLVGTRNYIPPHRQYYFFERIYPHTKTLGFVHRKGEPNSDIQYREFQEMLAKRDIAIIDIAALDLNDMRSKLEAFINTVDSLYAACDTLIQAGGEDLVIEFSKKYNKPSFSCNLDGPSRGALIGNVADLYTIGKMSGEKAAEILSGAKPQWLTTETLHLDHIVINEKTAKILSLKIPQDVMAKAARVIYE